LGMLSKYTIVLLGLGALVFLAFDRSSRRWVRVVDVLLVPLLAVILFSPVIVWNARHDWASFHFQGPRRFSAPMQFSLPGLVEGVLLLLTPTVFWGAVLALFRHTSRHSIEHSDEAANARWLFGRIFTLVPLSIFVMFSLFHPAKSEWTGPVWLAILPAVAQNIVPSLSKIGWRFKLNFRIWKPTAWALAILFGGLLYYVSIGFPGVGYTVRHFPIGWDELGREIELVEDDLELTSKTEPLIVGVDQYYLASEIAFYRRKSGANSTGLKKAEAVEHTTSWQVFGQDGLMYGYWFDPLSIGDSPLILVGYKPEELDRQQIILQFRELGAIKQLDTFKNSFPTRRFYYRICHGYKAPSGTQAKTAAHFFTKFNK
jgi:dolichol-phosphate mannosyltransferase